MPVKASWIFLTWDSGTGGRADSSDPRPASDCCPCDGWGSTAWSGSAGPGPEPPELCPALSSQSPSVLAPHPGARPAAPRHSLVLPKHKMPRAEFIFKKTLSRFFCRLTASRSPTHCSAFFLTDTAGSLQRSDTVAKVSRLMGITSCLRSATSVCRGTAQDVWAHREPQGT